jgi:hypothetical protein
MWSLREIRIECTSVSDVGKLGQDMQDIKLSPETAI